MRGFVLCRLIPSAVVLLTLGTPSISSSQTIDPDLPCTNGKVRALVADGDVLYLGGEFTLVGRHTGRSAALDAVTGDPISAEVATPSAVVSAVVPDGDGGWFVGGSFYEVQKIFRQNLVHIISRTGRSPRGTRCGTPPVPPDKYSHSRLRLDALPWAEPSTRLSGAVPEQPVRDRRCDGDRAPLESQSQRPGEARWRSAAETSWSAARSARSAVSLAPTSRRSTRRRGAATGWDPHATGGGGLVSVLAVSGGVVHAGGFYSGIGNAVRSSLAALDLTTGLATSFDAHL